MNKHREEKYITQIHNANCWSYRVRFNGVSKIFSEEKYGDMAYKKAITYRNQLVMESDGELCFETVEDIFENLFDFFLLRSETERKYRIIYNKYMEKYSLVKISNVNRAMIVDCLNSMVFVASDNTITRCLVIWRKIILYSLSHEYISKDVTLGIKAPKSRVLSQPKDICVLDKQILTDLCSFVKTDLSILHDREMLPLVIWALYYTGCRPCELFALEKKDVKKGMIYINKELGSDRTSFDVVRECKTPTSIRQIPMTDECIQIVEKAKKLSASDLLFSDRFGKHYNVTSVGDRLHKVAKHHNIDFNLYALRHNFSTALINSNIDPRTHQELMGHKNYTMSVNYARSTNEQKKKALKCL